MRKQSKDLYHARRELESDNDTAIPACRVAFRRWYSWTPWPRFVMRQKGTMNMGRVAPEIYGYRRVNSYKCEIDQAEAQRAVMVVTLKKAGLSETQISRGMSVRYGGEELWWKDKIDYILNGYKYYCGRHLVYNADGEIVYPPFMEE